MNGIFHLPEQQISPDYKDAPIHKQIDIELAKDDMLMKLFSNNRRLLDCIFDGDEASFDSAELNFFGMELAALLTCYDHEIKDFREILRKRFARPLDAEAEQMAISYLDALVKERFEE